MTGREHDGQFLRRWSRRKIGDGTIDESPPEAGLPEDSDAIVPDGGNDPEELDSEIVADLPDIETLDKDSDYTVFLRDGVPESLKKLALRKLWLSDPVLANLDGLNDYDEDFGSILKTGAEYMQRLADAGEKFTRPGAVEGEVEEIEVTEEAEESDSDDSEPDTPTDMADAGQRGGDDPSAG
jgi:hypothetical protein